MNFYQIVVFAMAIAFAIISPIHGRVHEIKEEPTPNLERGKREHGGHGITGPVHTYVKTDKHANFKWGVRHHVGHHYAGRK